jgi:N-acetylneuraminic acid mutarotase
MTGRPVRACLLAFLMIAPAASALSELQEGPADFPGGALEGAAIVDGALTLAANASLDGSWSGPFGPKSPEQRYRQTMVYDSVHGVHLLYSGWNDFDDTWAYDAVANRWTQLFAHSPPGKRGGHMMAFDSRNGVTVLYGGMEEGDYYSDTWLYNYADNSWRQVHPSPFPPARDFGGMGYDPVNGVAVLFGGESPPGWEYYNDTWTYNVSTNRWALKKPALAPIGRYSECMAYCPPTGEFLLFGGYRHWIECRPEGNYSEWEYRTDLWSYNVSTNTWRELLESGPRDYRGIRFVYDAASGLMFLQGGSKAEMVFYDPLRNEWGRRQVASGPLDSHSPSVTYDERTREIIFFGVSAEHEDWPADTWSYNSSTNAWTPRDMRVFPYSSSHIAMAFDDRNGVAAVFGWGVICTYDVSKDRWTKARWTEESPFSRWDPALVYDSREGVFVMYSGMYGEGDIFNDTRTFNVTTGNWTLKNPAVSPPDGRGFSAVYDSDRGKVLLFGGRKGWNYFGGTWEYDTAADSWTKLEPPASPPARDGAGMIYDGQNRVAVLFGGNGQRGPLNDTWLYDPAANRWTQLFPPESPSARADFGFAFDPSRGEAVLFGGMGQYPPLNDAWAFNVSEHRWSRLRMPFSPAPRFGHQMVYDTVNSEFIMYGGTDLAIDFPEVWRLDLGGSAASGSYTSRPLDTGGRPVFGALEWESSLPAGTSARFQLRTCATQSGLENRPFAGPDGTAASYYTVSGHRISQENDGGRYVQYRALLYSSNRFASPAVKGVTVNFNLQHIVDALAPSAGDSWSGFRRVLWSVSDPDNDAISVDILLIGAEGAQPLADGVPASEGNWLWNTSTVRNGTYRIQIIARDGNLRIPLEAADTTPEFSVANEPVRPPGPPNRSPRISNLLPPAAFVGEEMVHRVLASDEDGDTLTYALTSAPAGMSLDPASGDLWWTPGRAQTGEQKVVLRVEDGRGGSAELASTVRVALRPASCTIIHPGPGAVLGGTANLAGTARNGSLALTAVEVRIDGGEWLNASGSSEWWRELNTRELGNGPHLLEARAGGDGSWSEPVSVQFTVRNPERARSSGFIPGMTVALLVFAILGGMALFGRRGIG